MRQEATEGRSAAAPVQEGGEAAVGAQRGCARRARRGAARLRPQGTEGRSAAAPAQGARRQGTEGRSAAAPAQGGEAAPTQEGGGARG
jgi:hypothetical protein